MHLWRLWIALGLAAAVAAAVDAAVVYKWTDADGVVHYSDQPEPGAEQITTAPGSGNGIGNQSAPAPAVAPKTAASVAHFAVFSIASPAKEQVFFNEEAVPVRLSVDPTVPAAQDIVWTLNGAPLTDQGPKAVAFSLSGLDRGTYVLAASITDSATGATAATDSVTFYVRQSSALAPLNPLRR
jgi:hypothetical protein